MKTRTDLLNHLAEKYQLKNYLEIGVQNPAQNFDKIRCTYKVSVDPDVKANPTILGTSDSFFKSFKMLGLPVFDLIFIDGLHTAEQVKKDFENSLKVLSPNGFIVLHDCNPEKEEHTIVPRPKPTGHWNGDVYKYAITLSEYNKFFTVAIDNGCGVYQNGGGKFYNNFSKGILDWGYFDKNRKQLLNLITWDEFISIDSHV